VTEAWERSHITVTEYHSHSHITSNIRTMGDKVYSHNSSYVKTLDLTVEYMFQLKAYI